MKRKIDIIIISVILLAISFYAVYRIGGVEANKNKTNQIEANRNKVNTKINTNTNNTNVNTQNTTKAEDPKSKIKLSLGGVTCHTAGSSEIRVYVDNDSSKNIKYIKVNLFEKRDGRIIQSDWTNDSSVILSGASQTIDTYFDFHSSESTLEVELDKVTFE